MLRCLMGQPATCASDPGLDLVEDEQGARIVGDPARGGKVVRRWHDHSRLPLDRLKDHGSDGLVHCLRERLDVAVGDEVHLAGKGPERIGLGRLPGQREGAHRAAMEPVGRRHHPGAPGESG